MYCAIIGDIIQSKKIEERASIQKKLVNVLNEMNHEYDRDIASKFSITLGDEFQGLLVNVNHALFIITNIKIAMYPTKIRYGIGIGSISTQINKELPIGADGHAYHAARNAINEMKMLENKHEPAKVNTMIKYQVNSNQHANSDLGVLQKDIKLLNTTLSACAYIEKSWTAKQIDVIKLKEENYTQINIASKLEINQSNVQRRIEASGYYTYRTCIANAQEYLVGVWERIHE